MSVQASWRNCRISTQKARLVADVIRGKGADAALILLSEMTTKAAQAYYKILSSAVANAENNHNHDASEMYISYAYADKGAWMRRYMARAKGRGDRIQKPFSHLTVKLDKKP